MVKIRLKREFLLIIMAIIIPGSSHIYLGLFRCGIVILTLTVALTLIPPIGDLGGNYVSIAIWIWQIYDVRKLIKENGDKYNNFLTFEITANENKCKSCGKGIDEQSSFCSHCGVRV